MDPKPAEKPIAKPASDALAKKRFFAISSFRIIGALLVLIGFTLISGGLTIAEPTTNRIIGVLCVLFGIFEFAIMPLILARRWRTPRA